MNRWVRRPVKGRGPPYPLRRSVTLVSATLAAGVGLWLLVRSLHAPRAGPDMVGRRLMVVDGQRVVLATATVVLIGVAAFALVLQQA